MGIFSGRCAQDVAVVAGLHLDRGVLAGSGLGDERVEMADAPESVGEVDAA